MADKDAEVFERIGALEIPARGIYGQSWDWNILDVQTGEILDPFEKREEIVFVLDGDHVITNDYHVFSLSKRKNVQELKDMKESFKDWEFRTSHFISLPAPEKYSFTDIRGNEGKGYAVFDPNTPVRKLIAQYGDEIGVWSWSTSEARGERSEHGKLKKDYAFSHPGWRVKIFPLPRSSQILGKDTEIAVVGDTFAIFDVESREKLRDIGFGGNTKFFSLPSGGLGEVFYEKEAETVLDVTASLDRKEKGFKEMEGFSRSKTIVSYPSTQGSIATPYGTLLIPGKKKGEYFYLIWYVGGAWMRGKTGEKLKEVQVEGKTPVYYADQFDRDLKKVGTFCECSFHDSDVGFVSGEWKSEKLTILDLETGKVKQTLGVPELKNSPALPLSRSRYLLDLKSGSRRLMEYDPKTDKYSLGPEYQLRFLLPASSKQRKLLASKLSRLLTKVPSEVAGIVAGFI